MVVIRLARGGAKKRPFFNVIAADKRCPRDGRYIERLGYFNPIASGKEIKLSIDRERISYWLSKGAQMTERVMTLVADWDKQIVTEGKIS